MANTTNRGYPLPIDTKTVRQEIENLQQNVLPMIDADVQDLVDQIGGLAPIDHTHDIGEITDLTETLAGKMPADTTFALSDLTDVVGSAEAPDGYVLAKIGDEFVAQAALAALGPHGHTIAEVSGLDTALSGVNTALDSITDTLMQKALAASVVVHDADQELSAAAQAQARANIGVVDSRGGLRNLLINPLGLINQRGYTNGTSLGAANRYSIDRWKVVVSGQVLAWVVTDGYRVFTAPAGGVEQPVEGYLILPGEHVLSWEGSATATVNGVAVAKGEVFTPTAGTNLVVRFSGGTFYRPQLERSSTVTPFASNDEVLEKLRCRRYYFYQDGITLIGGSGGGGAYAYGTLALQVTMRVNPSIALVGGTSSNSSGLGVGGVYKDSVYFSVYCGGGGNFYAYAYVILDAEI